MVTNSLLIRQELTMVVMFRVSFWSKLKPKRNMTRPAFASSPWESGLMAEWPHGNFAGTSHRADVGRGGFCRAIRNSSHGHTTHHALHAVHRSCASHDSLALARRLGPPRRWFRLAAVGLGIRCRFFQRVFLPRALPRV